MRTGEFLMRTNGEDTQWDGQMRAKLFPGMEPMLIDRATALHLFRLLQQYNACLSDPKFYKARWSEFWPLLDELERRMVVLVVKANGDGEFGKRVRVCHAPVDFEQYENNCLRAVPDEAVTRKFRQLLSTHFRRLASDLEVREYLSLLCPKESALVSSLYGWDRLFSADVGLHPDLAAKACRDLFLEHGWSKDAAELFGMRIGEGLEQCLTERERALLDD